MKNNEKEMKNAELKEAIAKYIESKELVLMGYSPEYIDDVKKDMEIAFRAGAEWMAGQGVKIGETEIYLEYELEGSPYSQQWLSLENTEFKIHDGVFKTGDEVEVILRKKQ